MLVSLLPVKVLDRLLFKVDGGAAPKAGNFKLAAKAPTTEPRGRFTGVLGVLEAGVTGAEAATAEGARVGAGPVVEDVLLAAGRAPTPVVVLVGAELLFCCAPKNGLATLFAVGRGGELTVLLLVLATGVASTWVVSFCSSFLAVSLVSGLCDEEEEEEVTTIVNGIAAAVFSCSFVVTLVLAGALLVARKRILAGEGAGAVAAVGALLSPLVVAEAEEGPRERLARLGPLARDLVAWTNGAGAA